MIKLLQISSETFSLHSDKSSAVIGVIAVIFIGIVVYLIRLDNKIKKLEK